MTEDDDTLPEDSVAFFGCICDHDPDDHGWGECDVPDCPCEGGWEE